MDSDQSLQSQCRNIECRLDEERKRLRLAKETLEQYQVKEDIQEEKEKNAKREETIRECREKIEMLKIEYAALRKEISEIEAERTDIIAPQYEKKKRSLNLLSAEVEARNGEISNLDKQIERLKEINLCLEEDGREKFEEYKENRDSGAEAKVNALVHLGSLSVAEEHTDAQVKGLNEKETKLQNQIQILLDNVFELQKECHSEEQIVEEMVDGIEEIRKVRNLLDKLQ